MFYLNIQINNTAYFTIYEVVLFNYFHVIKIISNTLDFLISLMPFAGNYDNIIWLSQLTSCFNSLSSVCNRYTL
jgi:hypothetical protein